jgi:asparagine N-glycosylation enzyme membrane subunit Stt3
MKKIFEKINIANILLLFFLVSILWFGYLIRTITHTDIPLDYDPWWFYRHAKEIIEKKDYFWDVVSYFPPGRPYFVDGYSFSIAFLYQIFSKFSNISFEKFCVYFVVFYAIIASFLAFLLSYYLTRNFFLSIVSCAIILFSPSFVSSSIAGYVDSDVVYVFFTYLCVLSTLIFINKVENIKNIKNIPNIIPHFVFLAISYILFAWNWNSAYYISNIFLLSLFLLYILTLIVEYFKNKKLKIINKQFFILLSFIVSLATIQLFSILLEKLFYPYLSLPKPFDTLISQIELLIKGGLTYASLVNISVAELQKINIFSDEIIGRVGFFPFFISLIGMAMLILERIIKRKSISTNEFFLIVWFFSSLFLISQGIRFSLLFATSLAIFTSYSLNFIFNFLMNLVKNFKNIAIFFNSSFVVAVLFALYFYIGQANEYAKGLKGLEINENWRNALDFLKKNGNETTLVATWWDPGHIIAGYTNLKVHADGAHCGWNDCIPYNHDIRIQDMGRILSTTNETEAYELLKKYTSITEEDCRKVKKSFPFFNESICNLRINKVYFIASHDLIFKFYWPVYFSSCIREKYPNTEICYTKEGIEEYFFKQKHAKGKQFIPFVLNIEKSTQDKLVYISYQTIHDQTVEIPIYVIRKNNTFVAILRNKPVERFVMEGIEYFAKDAGYKEYEKFTVFSDPIYKFGNIPVYVYLVDEELSNSMFAKMYFLNGKDLKLFKLVFSNPEIKIYEIDF